MKMNKQGKISVLKFIVGIIGFITLIFLITGGSIAGLLGGFNLTAIPVPVWIGLIIFIGFVILRGK
jgi:hypothetical protein